MLLTTLFATRYNDKPTPASSGALPLLSFDSFDDSRITIRLRVASEIGIQEQPQMARLNCLCTNQYAELFEPNIDHRHDGVVVLPTADPVKLHPKNGCRRRHRL
jgi:hypothetical protein